MQQEKLCIPRSSNIADQQPCVLDPVCQLRDDRLAPCTIQEIPSNPQCRPRNGQGLNCSISLGCRYRDDRLLPCSKGATASCQLRSDTGSPCQPAPGCQYRRRSDRTDCDMNSGPECVLLTEKGLPCTIVQQQQQPKCRLRDSGLRPCQWDSTLEGGQDCSYKDTTGKLCKMDQNICTLYDAAMLPCQMASSSTCAYRRWTSENRVESCKMTFAGNPLTSKSYSSY